MLEGLRRDLVDVGPGEAVAVPERVEGGVGGVGEAVPVAEVVEPALALRVR